jgi:hypothetical protein
MLAEPTQRPGSLLRVASGSRLLDHAGTWLLDASSFVFAVMPGVRTPLSPLLL